MTLKVSAYRDDLKSTWDRFVGTSKNGTFLFLRDYMDYHADRFADNSLLISEDDQIVALFPANRSDSDIVSHQGLTYGGLITGASMKTPIMLDAFIALNEHLRKQGAQAVFYKTIPHIYHRAAAEEDRYALFLANAELYRRDVLSVVTARGRLPPQQRRLRGAKKAAALGIELNRCVDWSGYWSLLSDHLRSKFDIAPVHNLREIELLHSRFPENICLHLARLGEEIVAGTVIFRCPTVAHVQYIASSERGREIGALDGLFFHLLEDVYPGVPYFDFGISNEAEGRILNRGLIEQKEGYGARAVVHDFYKWSL